MAVVPLPLALLSSVFLAGNSLVISRFFGSLLDLADCMAGGDLRLVPSLHVTEGWIKKGHVGSGCPSQL